MLFRSKLAAAKFIWKTASKFACMFAYGFSKIGLHKQIGNRILEPWQYINVIVTSTEWDNFFNLRMHKDAQPEIKELATAIFNEMKASKPTQLAHGQWHLPYVNVVEGISEDEYYDIISDLLKASTARCARVSFSNHDGTDPDIQKDIALHDRLVGSVPIHASPAEHQATPANPDYWYRNFRGWVQYRDRIEEKLMQEEEYEYPLECD